MPTAVHHPHPVPIRTSDLIATDNGDRALRRCAARGTLTRVAIGAYLDSNLWRALSSREQYVLRVQTHLSRLAPSIVASHWSAAALWGFPVPAQWPSETQVIDVRRKTSTRSGVLHRRPGTLADDDVANWQGIRITCPARTAVDVALTSPFGDGVLVFDHGLHAGLFTAEEASDQLERRTGAPRLPTARKALALASPLVESPGETYSRVSMASRGLEPPVLQMAFDDAGGRIGKVDFWWPAEGIIGEFDGDWKYTDERFLQGRTAARVIRDEKRRQARLDAHPEVKRVIRWDYGVARDPDELAGRLLAAGVRRTRVGRRVPS